MKRTFYISDKGDPSVGIPPLEAKVTFEDNISKYDEHDIENTKEFLAGFYEVDIAGVQEESEVLKEEIKELETNTIPSLQEEVNKAKSDGSKISKELFLDLHTSINNLATKKFQLKQVEQKQLKSIK